MSKPFGMAWPVDMTNDVTLNQFRPYKDSDETHYWIDIHGGKVPLTKEQFIAMHDARIQLWDKATEYAEDRIIKLLEDAQVTEAELFDGRTIKVKSQSVRADLLIELIKGENK
jgi:hypothetical protein